MPRGEVQGVKNAPMGVQSKGRWLSLHYLWPGMIHVTAPFSRQAQQTPASPAGLSLKLWEAFPDLPHPNASHAPTTLWAPAVALHSSSQVPVYMSAFPVRLGLYICIVPPLAQQFSVFADGVSPLLPTSNHLRHFSSWSQQRW